MHIHILGICGTFMGGIAAIAQSLGHTVSGSDQQVYPPMSDQLEALGIVLKEGYLAEHLIPAPDLVIVGNACKRGDPAVEYLLNAKLPFTSGPQWLRDQVLCDKWVLAVSGTHGKTTTASMLAWLLESAGKSPGFLIGGVMEHFSVSARIGDSSFFVVEADEYDSAFFDKRSKFVHYLPRTLIINNLEYDHADIFSSIEDIQRQFHHMVRTVPSDGVILANRQSDSIEQTLRQGYWSRVSWVNGVDADWQAELLKPDGSEFALWHAGECQGVVDWSLIGEHNVQNALMAVAAAADVGVKPIDSIQALRQFNSPKRRLELKGVVDDVFVYDDFAHHPTAIATTVAGLRAKVGKANIIVIVEPRSATMKSPTHQSSLPQAFNQASMVYLFQPPDIRCDLQQVATHSVVPCYVIDKIDEIVRQVVDKAQPGDHLLVMSNGDFGGIHQKLLQRLKTR